MFFKGLETCCEDENDHKKVAYIEKDRALVNKNNKNIKSLK